MGVGWLGHGVQAAGLGLVAVVTLVAATRRSCYHKGCQKVESGCHTAPAQGQQDQLHVQQLRLPQHLGQELRDPLHTG